MAVLFQVVLMAVYLAREYRGASGVYTSAAILGLTDVDALTASMARDVAQTISPQVGATAIAIGVLTNTGMKLALTLLIPLATAGLVLVLVIFMLLKHADLRNRLIALAGYGQMTLATKALDEAGQRISRYLLMQSLINGSFGLLFGLGLFVVGLPYAVLWGFLAAVLRFIPYVGTLLAGGVHVFPEAECDEILVGFDVADVLAVLNVER